MKEIIISIIIIVSITVGSKITQDYTKYAVEETSTLLNLLRKDIIESKEKENLEESINNIHTQWDKKHNKLAYYIEHDELEKVETGLTSLRAYIEMEDETESVSKIDETIYILRHIEDKNKFNLQNIF